MDEIEKLLGEINASPEMILFKKDERPQLTDGQIMGLLGQALNHTTFKLDLDVDELKAFHEMQAKKSEKPNE